MLDVHTHSIYIVHVYVHVHVQAYYVHECQHCMYTMDVPLRVRNAKSKSKNSFLLSSSENWYWLVIHCVKVHVQCTRKHVYSLKAGLHCNKLLYINLRASADTT